ncbi:hypothetical protein BsWGS_26863 [Bradybaena similaris]
MAGTVDLRKFAEELHWCIGQLELGLQRQSPDSRQAAESLKLLKILKSTKAPMVKKRQVMRNAFGDYRKKMKDAEKKSLAGLRQSRFQPLGSAKTLKNSRFLRMSYSKQHPGLVSNELSGNLSSLNLESSTCEPVISWSEISPEAAAGNSHHPGGSDGFSVSSSRTVLGNTQVFGLVQSNLSTGTEGNQNSVDSAKIHSSGSSSGSSSANAGTPAHVSAISHCGQTNETKPVSGFKYEPSGNSFVFGFESPENETNPELLPTESETSGSAIASHLTGNSCRTITGNVFKYEKSVNDFRFNFAMNNGEP